MKKLILLTIIALMLTSSVLACREEYDSSDNVIINDVIEEIGLGADCNITLYKNNTLIQTSWMTQHGLAYTYDAGELEHGIYLSNIECNLTNASFLGECTFEVGGSDTVYIAIGIILIAAIAFLIYMGSQFNHIHFDFPFTGDKYIQMPYIQFLFYIVAGWLSVAVINVAVIANDLEGTGVTGTIDGVYKAVMYLMYFLTTIWLLGVVFYFLIKFYEKASNIRT